jgi:TRAP transporter TAXI family solute receptor
MSEKNKDTVNRKALIGATIPLVVSVLLLAGLYYKFFVLDAQPRIVRIATDIQGSITQELMESIGSQMQQKNESIKIEYVTTEGTSENIRLLQSKKIDFAAIPSDAVSRPNFSLVAQLYADTFHIIVHADSNIKTLHDLPGKKIAVPPLSSSAYRSFWYLIGHYGLSPESIIAKPMTANKAFTALRKLEVDAIFYMQPPANRITRWIAEAVRIRILPIDQADAMALRRHSLEPTTIPKGIYAGDPPIPNQSIKSVATDRILITRNDVPDDLVRAITAVMFENRRELSLSSRIATFIRKPNMSSGTILPVHPGAIAFYDRDQPSFLQENAEPIGVLFSIFAVLVSGGLWVKRRWEERQKGRIDVYNLDLVSITEAARAAKNSKELTTSRADLFDMLTQVVRDLDEDKIDGEGFHFFAFTWEAAFSVISEKERELGIVSPVPPPAKSSLEKLKKT